MKLDNIVKWFKASVAIVTQLLHRVELDEQHLTVILFNGYLGAHRIDEVTLSPL